MLRSVSKLGRTVIATENGATGDGVTDDSAAIQNAIDKTALAGGGFVFFPEGTYLCSSFVRGKAGVGLYGEGHKSIIKSSGTGNGAIKYIDDECRNITISDLAFDIASKADFHAGLNFQALTSGDEGPVHISRCKFFDSNKAAQGNWTMQGLIARGVSDLTVVNNYCDGVQMKLTGSADNKRLVCSGNISFEPSAHGISIVTDTDKNLENVVCSGNIIVNPRRTSLFIGQDGEGVTGATTRNISIYNNVCIAGNKQVSSTNAVITVKQGDTSENINICGNIVVGFDSGGGTITGAGIDTIQSNPSVGVNITGNTLHGPFSVRGIIVTGEQSVNVSNNTIVGDMPQSIRADEASGKISGNVIDGEGAGACRIHVEDADGILVVDNFLRNLDIATSTGAITLNSSASDTTKAIVRGNVTQDTGVTFDHAIDAVNGGTFDITIEDNDFRELNSTVFAAGGNEGDINVLRRNRGYVTENSGTSTIASGTTSIAVTHGLDVVPTLDQITITLGEQSSNAPGQVWVDTIGDTTFAVNVANNPGASNLDFGWRVSTV